MAAARAITRVVGYSAAKAAVENLTRWLAVELAPAITVNAIAPGFFVGEQNRRLLLDEDGELTDRGRGDRRAARRPGASARPRSWSARCSGCAGRARVSSPARRSPVDGGFGAFSRRC